MINRPTTPEEWIEFHKAEIRQHQADNAAIREEFQRKHDELVKSANEHRAACEKRMVEAETTVKAIAIELAGAKTERDDAKRQLSQANATIADLEAKVANMEGHPNVVAARKEAARNRAAKLAAEIAAIKVEHGIDVVS